MQPPKLTRSRARPSLFWFWIWMTKVTSESFALHSLLNGSSSHVDIISWSKASFSCKVRSSVLYPRSVPMNSLLPECYRGSSRKEKRERFTGVGEIYRCGMRSISGRDNSPLPPPIWRTRRRTVRVNDTGMANTKSSSSSISAKILSTNPTARWA